MQPLTDLDYDLDRYQEDEMNARGLRFRPVSPYIKAMAERMRQEPKVERTPKLSGLDEAVMRSQAEKGGSR